MTSLEKLRAGIVKIPCSCGKPGCVLQLREETESLMRQAADEIEALRSLAREVMRWHSDIDSPEYNECDTDPCNWCEQARKFVAEEKP